MKEKTMRKLIQEDNIIYFNLWKKYCKIYERKNKLTGKVVCPASSIMHTSNFVLASKGLEMPRQVTATTLTCSNLLLISSTPCTLIAEIETTVKRFITNLIIIK